LPQSFLCGYIAFRFQDIGDFTESMFGDTKLTFIVAACKRFEAELVLTDLESEQNQVFGFFLSTLVSTFSTTMLDEKYIPSSLRLSPNPIEIKRLL
jgi:hypothetical protein